jgi:DNA methylase
MSIKRKHERLWGEYAVVGISGEKIATFQRLRKDGFPHYDLSKKEKAKELRSLFHYGPASIVGGEIAQTMHALSFCWSYHPHAWDVRCGDMLTPMEVFHDDKKLWNALGKRAEYGSVSRLTDSEVRKGLKSVTGAQGVSNFRPSAAWAIYDRHCPEDATVYDSSMGWGGRLLGAVGCLKVARYIGCDPATKTFEGLKRMEQDITRMMPNRHLAVEMHMLGSEDFRPEPGSVDVAFTSPPYFEGGDVVERYNDESTQSHIRFPQLGQWLEGFMGQTIRNCREALKPGGTLVLNVSDDLAEAITEVATKNGFAHAETLRLRLSKIMGSKHKRGGSWKTEPVLVFKRK